MSVEAEQRAITRAKESKEAVAADGVEFLSAMFVDVHGTPCAKMVPVSVMDGLMEGGAGFAGLAAGAMGPSPSSPDTDGSANPYFALSALFAAGLDGIVRGADPGDPCDLNLLDLREDGA